MTRTELERRLRLPMRSLAAQHASAADYEIAKEILLDVIEKICAEVELHTTMNIAKSVRRA